MMCFKCGGGTQVEGETKYRMYDDHYWVWTERVCGCGERFLEFYGCCVISGKVEPELIVRGVDEQG